MMIDLVMELLKRERVICVETVSQTLGLSRDKAILLINIILDQGLYDRIELKNDTISCGTCKDLCSSNICK